MVEPPGELNMDEYWEPEDLSEQTRKIWDANASWWDEKVGEGNQFQRELIGPATDKLLDVKERETILDIACGNGNYARRLADQGAQVMACDFSEIFIQRAQEKSKGYENRIKFRVIDATDKEQLLALGRDRYDAAVCTMAIMDMVMINPLFQMLPRLLVPGGRFVFSITHPCFNSGHIVRVAEEEDLNGELNTRYGVKVFDYRDERPLMGIGIIGQPEPQFYFHRTLSTIVNTCFSAGFIIDGLEEPYFEPNAKATRVFSWSNFTKIPPVLLIRARLVSKVN